MAAHPGQSGFLLLKSGLDAFVARAVLTHTAERSIDLQYYLYHDDLVGHLLMDQLVKAADRGVRVRLLVDDMDLAGKDLGAALLDSHPSMDVRIFNPFSRQTFRGLQFLTRFGRVTRRMHNKSFTVDNQVTVLGGRNIGDQYFEADPDLAFSDLDAMIIGPVVDEVSTAFDRYWNSDLAYPATVLYGKPTPPEAFEHGRKALTAFVAEHAGSPYMKALRNSDLAIRLRGKQEVTFNWGRAEVVYDQPEKLLHDRSRTEYHLAPQLRSLFRDTREELIIFSPYFVPGKAGTDALCRLSQRGVRVRILTNSLASNDVGIVHAGYARYRKDLLRGGVELYELDKQLTREQRRDPKGVSGSSKASLHAKSFVFDRGKVFIGSLNFDPRSVVENTEIGVVLDSTEVGRKMGQWFDEMVATGTFRLELLKSKSGIERIRWHGQEEGKPRVFDADPHTGFWRRLGIGLMGLLPIESQL
jgi:putative cardiolipin synthase